MKSVKMIKMMTMIPKRLAVIVNSKMITKIFIIPKSYPLPNYTLTFFKDSRNFPITLILKYQRFKRKKKKKRLNCYFKVLNKGIRT